MRWLRPFRDREFWVRLVVSGGITAGVWQVAPGLPALLAGSFGGPMLIALCRWPARRLKEAEQRILTVVSVGNGRPVAMRSVVWATGLGPSRGSVALSRLRQSGRLVVHETPAGVAFTVPGDADDSGPGLYL